MISRSNSRVRRLATFGAIAATAALVLTGCSGGLAGGDGGGSSDGPIKLGMLAPFSGSEAAFGDYMKFGAQLAIDEINAEGGVDGRDLELVTEDDGCDATQAVSAANKLVSAGVHGSVGGYCSGATLPTLPVFEGAGVPMVIPAANSTKLVDQGAFLINGTGTQQAAAAIAYAEKLGSKNVVLIDDNTDYSVDLANSFEEQAGSLNIVKRESVNPDEKDFAVAPAGTAIPAGERRTFAAGPRKVPPVAKAPTLSRAILARGSADGPKFPGNDVHELQARLKEIGYYTGPITGVFDSSTDDAAKAFQADYFSPAEANGRVGPKTWAKLFPVRKTPPATPGPVKQAPVKAAPTPPGQPKKARPAPSPWKPFITRFRWETGTSPTAAIPARWLV